VIKSREEQRRAPERYLASYPDLTMDEDSVLLTEDQFEKIKRHCGRYDGCFPTGVYLGKMFLRGECLCWFAIAKVKPLTDYSIEVRRIELVEKAVVA